MMLIISPYDLNALPPFPHHPYHQHADGWTITRQDLVLLTETRAMLRSSAIGVARAWPHLVYHQLVLSSTKNEHECRRGQCQGR